MLPVFSNNSQAVFAAPFSSLLSRITPSRYQFAKGVKNYARLHVLAGIGWARCKFVDKMLRYHTRPVIALAS